MSTEVIRVIVYVIGRVQGVFFRASTKRKAIEFNLTGFVRNESDGSVYYEAQGSKENVQKLIAWTRKGPEFSKVTKVTFNRIDTKDENTFEISHH